MVLELFILNISKFKKLLLNTFLTALSNRNNDFIFQ